MTNMKEKEIIKIINGIAKPLPVEGDSVAVTLEKSKKDGYIGDLENKPLPQLLDLLHRQEKLVHNKKLLSQLKDKGSKILTRYSEIKDAIEKSQNLCKPDTKYNLDEFEWKSKNALNTQNEVKQSGNVKAPEDYPLILMANHDSVPVHKYIEDPSTEILNELEKLNIKDGAKDVFPKPTTIEAAAMQKIDNRSNLFKEPFKPHKSLLNKKSSTSKKESLLWDFSSATGPVQCSEFKPTKLLPLTESSDLLTEQNERDKERHLYEASKVLARTTNAKMKMPEKNILKYRDVKASKDLGPEE